MSFVLYPDQAQAISDARSCIGDGHRCTIMVAPVGWGKSVVAGQLMKDAYEKGSRVAFVVDRVTLARQFSETLGRFGLPHGIAQGDNTRDRDARLQICSAQTVEKRGFLPGLDLLIVDECHSQRRFITDFSKDASVPVIGLTATPFTEGMGQIYTGLVSTTTTNELIENGRLAALKVYAAKQIDMSGARVVAGEWTAKDVTQRGTRIVGDVVSEWVAKIHLHFGGPVKTLCFSASVAHGAEICSHFQAAGYNFQQVSYRDGNDESRMALIDEFRKPDSSIDGLVSVEALTKGFDVPDVLCGIGARPYRKSFSGHIQQLGRVMRSHPGKDFALWLDHSGNYLGFLDRTLDLFQHGVTSLDDSQRAQAPRVERTKESADVCCLACGFVLEPGLLCCPSCGKERVRRNRVEVVPGELSEVQPRKASKPYLQDRKETWRQICHNALNRKKGDIAAANKFALAQYRNFYDEWPRGLKFDPASHCDEALEKHITANLIRYRHRRRAA